MPVIMCTGFSERIDREKAIHLGVKGFIENPTVKSELTEMIRKVLDESALENQGNPI